MRVIKTCVGIGYVPGVGFTAQDSSRPPGRPRCLHADHVALTARGTVATSVADLEAGSVARFLCRADVVRDGGGVLESSAVLCCKACARRFMEGV
jgi:hypothetical protein